MAWDYLDLTASGLSVRIAALILGWLAFGQQTDLVLGKIKLGHYPSV
jgi:hypothetical protein